MKKVLFVCLGNICRSTMAEGILSNKIKQHNLEDQLSCFSVGTASYHIGSTPDYRTLEVLEANGIEYEHFGTQLEPHHLKTYDYVFAMDASNLANIKSMERENDMESKSILFREKYGEDTKTEVPDPYYGGEDGFLKVYEVLDRCCNNFIKEFI